MDPILLESLTDPKVLVLLNLLSFLLGLLVGNWLAISRDRRKEFNEAAQSVRATLLKHRQHLSPMDDWPTAVDIDLLERLLPFWKRNGFRNAIERYRASKEKAERRDSFGGVFYSDTTAIAADLERFISYTNWH